MGVVWVGMAEARELAPVGERISARECGGAKRRACRLSKGTSTSECLSALIK